MAIALAAMASAMGAAAAQPGEEQRIRKCVEASGRVSYQATPCAAPAAEHWSAPLVPESSEQAARAERAREELARNMPAPRTARGNAARRVHVNPLRQRAQVAPCEVAQRKAAEERDRDWYRIKFDRLRQLDDWVASQCAD